MVKRGNAKIAFSLKCCISALSEFNHLLDFFSLFNSRLTLTLLYDSLSLVINAFSYRRKEVDSAAAVGLCCTHSTSALCSGFHILQGIAEALDRWGGKTKHHMIPYFLSNISAKNYSNRIVYVKIKLIASRGWNFFETRCIICCIFGILPPDVTLIILLHA